MPRRYLALRHQEEVAVEDAAEYVARLEPRSIKELIAIVKIAERGIHDTLLQDWFELSLPRESLTVKQQTIAQVKHHRVHGVWSRRPLEIAESPAPSRTNRLHPDRLCNARTMPRTAWRSGLHDGLRSMSPVPHVADGGGDQHVDWSNASIISEEDDRPAVSNPAYDLSMSQNTIDLPSADIIDLKLDDDDDDDGRAPPSLRVTPRRDLTLDGTVSNVQSSRIDSPHFDSPDTVDDLDNVNCITTAKANELDRSSDDSEDDGPLRLQRRRYVSNAPDHITIDDSDDDAPLRLRRRRYRPSALDYITIATADESSGDHAKSSTPFWLKRRRLSSTPSDIVEDDDMPGTPSRSPKRTKYGSPDLPKPRSASEEACVIDMLAASDVGSDDESDRGDSGPTNDLETVNDSPDVTQSTGSRHSPDGAGPRQNDEFLMGMPESEAQEARSGLDQQPPGRSVSRARSFSITSSLRDPDGQGLDTAMRAFSLPPVLYESTIEDMPSIDDNGASQTQVVHNSGVRAQTPQGAQEESTGAGLNTSPLPTSTHMTPPSINSHNTAFQLPTPPNTEPKANRNVSIRGRATRSDSRGGQPSLQDGHAQSRRGRSSQTTRQRSSARTDRRELSIADTPIRVVPAATPQLALRGILARFRSSQATRQRSTARTDCRERRHAGASGPAAPPQSPQRSLQDGHAQSRSSRRTQERSSGRSDRRERRHADRSGPAAPPRTPQARPILTGAASQVIELTSDDDDDDHDHDHDGGGGGGDSESPPGPSSHGASRRSASHPAPHRAVATETVDSPTTTTGTDTPTSNPSGDPTALNDQRTARYWATGYYACITRFTEKTGRLIIHVASVKEMQNGHGERMTALEGRIETRDRRIAALERELETVRTALRAAGVRTVGL